MWTVWVYAWLGWDVTFLSFEFFLLMRVRIREHSLGFKGEIEYFGTRQVVGNAVQLKNQDWRFEWWTGGERTILILDKNRNLVHGCMDPIASRILDQVFGA